jgi:shikimate dehydrogenase
VLIGMGPAGRLSRTHYRAFGSPWTYVAACSEQTTAPGQLDRATALAMGLPESASWPFFALLGGAQVLSSPGPATYRRLLQRLGLELGYVPVVTRSLTATLPLLERLGLRGASVTMPLKAEALAVAAPDALAQRAAAVNTLLPGEGGWRGSNTDVAGVREPLRAAGASGRALVLGAGGAARAAALACAELGMTVTLAARRPAEALRWASAAGLPVTAIDWNERASSSADLLVNATPLGGERSPWPEAAPLPATVFDLALAGSPSALLAQARSAGRRCLGPEAMWCAQGAAQMSALLGRPIDAAELEELLP